MNKKTITQKEIEKLAGKFLPVAPANPSAKLPKGKGSYGGNYPMDSDKRFAARLARYKAELAAVGAARSESDAAAFS